MLLVIQRVPSGLTAAPRTRASGTFPRVEQRSGPRVPQPGGPVIAARDEQPAGAERRHEDRVGVVAQGVDLAGRCHVPDPHRPILAAGGQPPLRAEGEAEDHIRVAVESDARAAGARAGGRAVPDPQRPVVGGGGEPPALRVEEHAGDEVAVPAQGEHLPAPVQLPDADRLVDAARGKPPATRVERHAADPVGVALPGCGRSAPVHALWTFTAGSAHPPGDRQDTAVGAERHDPRRVGMAAQCEQLPAARC